MADLKEIRGAARSGLTVTSKPTVKIASGVTIFPRIEPCADSGPHNVSMLGMPHLMEFFIRGNTWIFGALPPEDWHVVSRDEWATSLVNMSVSIMDKHTCNKRMHHAILRGGISEKLFDVIEVRSKSLRTKVVFFESPNGPSWKIDAWCDLKGNWRRET